MFNRKTTLSATAGGGILISIYFLVAASTTLSINGGNVYGQLGLNPIPTSQEVIATYVIRIPPGAALEESPIHYYPDNVAIPSGITIAWFNDDPG